VSDGSWYSATSTLISAPMQLDLAMISVHTMIEGPFYISYMEPTDYLHISSCSEATLQSLPLDKRPFKIVSENMDALYDRYSVRIPQFAVLPNTQTTSRYFTPEAVTYKIRQYLTRECNDRN